MTAILEGDCEVEFLAFQDPLGKETFWHSSAHVLGSAIEHIFHGYLTHGPPLKQGGFFYDIYVGDLNITPEDYKRIEEAVAKVAQSGSTFEKLLVTKKEALGLFEDNPFKRKIIEAKVDDSSLTSVYRCGDFVDLCTGPHIPSVKLVKSFKVSKNSACYWLGNQSNDTL